jgi:hypothetical protein
MPSVADLSGRFEARSVVVLDVQLGLAVPVPARYLGAFSVAADRTVSQTCPNVDDPSHPLTASGGPVPLTGFKAAMIAAFTETPPQVRNRPRPSSQTGTSCRPQRRPASSGTL